MLIKTCGTVSPYCHKNKNCPGYLIQEESSKVLLDCGNGVMRELNLTEDLENLTVIISHLHKDHYGDLLSLAYASYVHKSLGLLKRKIKVYLPKPNLEGEFIYNNINGEKITKQLESTLFDYLYLTNFQKEQYLDISTYDENTILKLGSLTINFAKNPHQVTTYSIKVSSNNQKLVYTSDTGYNGNIVTNFAKEADLLICEATYLEGQKRTIDNHLYAKEAGLIAKEANVKKLLLTHFWPEIPKEQYLFEAKLNFSETMVAEEGKILLLK